MVILYISILRHKLLADLHDPGLKVNIYTYFNVYKLKNSLEIQEKCKGKMDKPHYLQQRLQQKALLQLDMHSLVEH